DLVGGRPPRRPHVLPVNAPERRDVVEPAPPHDTEHGCGHGSVLPELAIAGDMHLGAVGPNALTSGKPSRRNLRRLAAQGNPTGRAPVLYLNLLIWDRQHTSARWRRSGLP